MAITASGGPLSARGDDLRRRAWVAIATIPAFFVLGFAAGEATLSALGHPTGGDVPTWASLIADVPATVLAALPGFAAFWWARQARREHVPGAVVPMAIGLVAAAAIVLLTIVTEVGNAI